MLPCRLSNCWCSFVRLAFFEPVISRTPEDAQQPFHFTEPGWPLNQMAQRSDQRPKVVRVLPSIGASS